MLMFKNTCSNVNYSQRSIVTVLVSVPLVTVACPQVLENATLMLVESVHVPAHVPAVGQLHVAPHDTAVGVNVQLTEVRLFKIVIPPPVIVLVFLFTPVTLIGADVEVVTSKATTPLGVVNFLRMPVFAKLKWVASTRVTV